MDAGTYAVKLNTLLDAIKLFQTYGFIIVAYNQSLFSACTNKSLYQNGASRNYKFKPVREGLFKKKNGKLSTFCG